MILKSYFLSVYINGKSHGYFNANRRVRQGDPLSLILLCLAEDVLGKSISKLVDEGKLERVQGTRNIYVPSNSFFADDLMIYCKGKISRLKALKDLFRRHALSSCQVTNTAKLTIFSTSISHNRLGQIFNLLDFKIGYLPFIYFGVPIFKGKLKVNHLQPITDMIKLKLSNWKASLLTMVGRVQLVRFMIQSMLTYSLSIYLWHV